MNISYSFGVMDLFHYGHLKGLKEAAKGADLHVVGLVSDKAARAWLGNIVSNESERRAVLESISCVGMVMSQETLDPTDNIKRLHALYPDAKITLFRGDDVALFAARQYLKSIGGETRSISYYGRLSPMEILKALNSRTEGFDRDGGIMSTKANTLLALKDRVTKSSIEDILVVTVDDARNSPERTADRIKSAFGGRTVVVRSSSRREDCFESSNAGHYESILDVDSSDSGAVIRALEDVYRSYGRDGDVAPDDQILVQAQTKGVKMSGVVFTRDIQKNRPYYVVNFDDTGSTDSVTSGAGGRTMWIAQDAGIESVPDEWKGLFEAVRELESIFKDMLLDIEFAIRSGGGVVVFQVRPLAASYKFGRDTSVGKLLETKNGIIGRYAKVREVVGSGMLSDMAFWNPAEIIGDNPNNLDYSLYRDLITHRAWNEGLVPMGYRKVPEDLMYRFGNKPYISLEFSFRSLMPASLPDGLAGKLEGHYMRKLSKDHSAHDKIEFEIVFSCFDFATDDALKELADAGFTASELAQTRSGLFDITRSAIGDYAGVLEADSAALREMESIREDVERRIAGEGRVQVLARAVNELLESIKRFGTPQFARQARYAFMAKSLATTLCDRGYWTRSDYDAFMSSVETVATRFERDFNRLLSGEMSREAFNAEYGHLRAGTYDISTPRYDEISFAPALGETGGGNVAAEGRKAPKWAGAAKAIADSGLGCTEDQLFAFMRSAFESREYFKFVFTRSLSRALEIVAAIGRKLGFSRRDMACFDISEILSFSLYDDEPRMAEYLAEMLPARRESHNLKSQVIMPNLITGPRDFNCVRAIDSRPNFITAKSVEADTADLDADPRRQVAGRIVLIEKADPGFDWIFTQGIVGLVTKYGGVASHMAIRCAEFGIPAAIGCGDAWFAYARERPRLKLDCRNGRIA